MSFFQAVCNSSISDSYLCTNYDGKMSLFLSNASSVAQASYLGRSAISNAMGNDDFASQIGLGLVKATYLGPALVEPEPATTEDPNGNVTSGNSADPQELGPASIAFVAIASAGIVVLIGSVYYWRRHRVAASSRAVDYQDGAATLAAGSSLNDTHSMVADMPRSPFSEMLPSAYRFNENMSIMSGGQDSGSGSSGLSVVIESPNGEAGMSPPSPATESIVVSESGYTTEAGGEDEESSFGCLDVHKSLYSTLPPESPNLLGAKKRLENQITANAMQNEADSMSDVSSSPQTSPQKSQAATSEGQGQKILLSIPQAKDSNNNNNNMADESMEADDALLFVERN
jgi:hypothetical protein